MGTAAKPTRENRTITVDFQNETTYVQLLGDGKAFVECVLAFLLALGFQLAHKATCKGGGGLTRHSHYARVRLGGLLIWLLLCAIAWPAARLYHQPGLVHFIPVCGFIAVIQGLNSTALF